MFLLALGAIAAGIGSLVGAGTAIASTVKQNEIADQELALAEEQAALAQEQADIEKESTLAGLRSDVGAMELNLLEYGEKLATYETALTRHSAYADVQKSSMKEQGRSQHNQLLGNFEGTAVGLAAQGRTAGSGALIESTARGALERFSGSDLQFNTTGGGLFAKQYRELEMDLGAKEQEITSQINIYKDSISSTKASIADLEGSIEDIEGEEE